MNLFTENIYTVILIPFWAMVLIFLGRLFSVISSRKVVNSISVASSVYCLIFSVGGFIRTVVEKGFVTEFNVPFLTIGNFNFTLGTYFDGISAWMLLLAVIISLLVQIYSISYMKSDVAYARFFGLLNLFNFSMFGLILSPNMFQMYVFWELVGISSYLLIGFWYRNPEASYAAKKAFIMNRIGDFSLLSGIILSAYIILSNLSNVSSVSLPFSDMMNISAQIYGCTSDGIFILTCVLLLGGSVAKSAQFPLNNWLVDAMKGPTPVSALIHSATMVAAGVFLLFRLYPLYSLNNIVLQIISVIGITTAILCSYSALAQTDIKKILAYSTNAQLGLMFLAVGCCSVTVSLFHLTTHAFAKAMLFLVAGCVIQALNHNQDIKFAGGLRKRMPLVAFTCLVGIISLSGIMFSGFASKELILGNLIEGGHFIYVTLFLLVSFMTAYYLFRFYFYVFEGQTKFEFELKNIDKTMTIIPVLLAIFVVVLWFILPMSNNVLFAGISIIISLFACIFAFVVYKHSNYFKKIPILYYLSYDGFYAENINCYVVKCYKNLANLLYLAEKYIFDGIVYISTIFTRVISFIFSKMQTGNVQSYLAYSVFIIMLSFGGVLLIYSILIYFSEVQ